MANDLLGERALPDSVQSRRRSLRNRLEDLRDPIRERRESTVPGPDLIGRGEDVVEQARTRVATRDSPIGSLLSRIRNRGDSPDNGNGGSGNGGNNSGNDSNSGSNAESDSQRRSNSLV